MLYEEAEEKMAKLMKPTRDYHYKYIKDMTTKERGEKLKSVDDVNDDDNYEIVSIEEYDKRKQEYDILKNKEKIFGEELASMPEFFDILKPYMVDVIGEKGACEGGECDLKEVIEDFTPNNLEKFLEKHGSIYQNVRDFLKANGFNITDSGGGADSWHLGVPCNESESRRMCYLVRQEFKEAFKIGFLRMRKMNWGWRLPTLWNGNDLEDYLEKKS